MPTDNLETGESNTLLVRFAPFTFLALLAVVGVLGHWLFKGSEFSGALLGAAVGGFVSLLLTQASDRRIAALTATYNRDRHLFRSISNTIDALSEGRYPWLVVDERLARYRTVYHSYHRTRDDQGEFWSYATLDLTEPSPGCLKGSNVIRRDHKSYTYNIHGILVRQRLVLLKSPEHDGERPAISIFDDVHPLDESKGFWGVQMHDDWRKSDGLDPCLLSRVALLDAGVGRVDGNGTEVLQKRWRELAPPESRWMELAKSLNPEAIAKR